MRRTTKSPLPLPAKSRPDRRDYDQAMRSLTHLALAVRDEDASRRFYEELTYDATTGDIISFTPNSGWDQTAGQILCPLLGGSPA
jgi:hypothetical protein